MLVRPTLALIVGRANYTSGMDWELSDLATPARLRSTPSWLLSRISFLAFRLVNTELAAIGARRYHYAVLAALDEFGPASQADLGRRCGIDRSDMVATINELTETGAVQRTPDPADGRRNIITITPTGRRTLRRLDTAVAKVQTQLLAPLSPADRDTLTTLLTRVVDHHPATAPR
jgi:DNA-binding MarR family transcriptional regulator